MGFSFSAEQRDRLLALLGRSDSGAWHLTEDVELALDAHGRTELTADPAGRSGSFQVADAPVEDISHASEYSFVLREIGRVHCTFSQCDGMCVLKVQRDSQAASLVEAIRPSPAPALHAEAKPDESAV